MQKEEARKWYASVRKELGEEKRLEKSRKIQKYLLESPFFLQTESLYTYVSYKTEVDTKEIIRKSLQLGKQVFVPKVYPDRQMEFFEITGLEELEIGFHGIWEPRVLDPVRKAPEKKEEQKLRFMLLPGLAFEESGNRLGYGGGYYDTYLARFPNDYFYKAGLCFSCQVAKAFTWNAECYDAFADSLVTEKGTLETKAAYTEKKRFC